MMIFELEFLFFFVPEARFIYLSIYLSRLSGFWLNNALFILQASPCLPVHQAYSGCILLSLPSLILKVLVYYIVLHNF